MAELVSETYANALFDTASDNDIVDRVKAEINSLYDILSENPDYAKILSSPIVGVKEKHELANAAFSGNICTYLLNFIFVLIDNDRFTSFYDIVLEFNKICDRKDNILRATAVTAVELSGEMLEKLQKKLCDLSKKNVVLANEVDSTLIGGIVLKYDNTEIDGSVKSQLDEVKKQVRAKML